VAGISIVKKHMAGPQGVRGRNSDNTRLRDILAWEPQISLEEGLSRTYRWIEAQVREKLVHPVADTVFSAVNRKGNECRCVCGITD
jgi:hypothetical protein